MAGPIKDLIQLHRHGGCVRSECACGRVALWETGELIRYWRTRRPPWTISWPDFARHMRCSVCGSAAPKVFWQESDPPPPDYDPPKPRFQRQGRIAAPEPTNVVVLDHRRRRAA